LTEREWFKPYCPACNVTAQYPPTVLIHGTADNDVLCDGAVKMDEALTQANVPHKLVTITGGRQAFGGSPEIARVFGSALAFVEEPMGT
jgi:dipeptidyl aminopeptidase/acylaminoacyl peptidase